MKTITRTYAILDGVLIITLPATGDVAEMIIRDDYRGTRRRVITREQAARMIAEREAIDDLHSASRVAITIADRMALHVLGEGAFLATEFGQGNTHLEYSSSDRKRYAIITLYDGHVYLSHTDNYRAA